MDKLKAQVNRKRMALCRRELKRAQTALAKATQAMLDASRAMQQAEDMTMRAHSDLLSEQRAQRGSYESC